MPAAADASKAWLPGATITSFKTDVGAVLLDSWILGAFDWILTHPEKKIRVSSNSWGCCDGSDYKPDDPVNVATKALYDAGVSVAFAASNSGGPNTLNPYSASPWVISVAAGTKELKLASFSSRGRIEGPWDRRAAQSTNTGIYRPTVTAPGEMIEAAKSSQATVMAAGIDPEFPLYTYADGTSMATPHVAGVVALMLQAKPDLKPQHVIDILEGTADNMPTYEIFEVGLGHLDALGAVQAAEAGRIKLRPSVNGKTPQFTLTGANAFSGTVLAPNTWQLAQCPDTTGLLNHHTFTIGTGVDAIYTEIEWGDPNQLIYLRLYDPSCQVAGESAALLDITSVEHRAIVVTSPQAGTWTVGVYGRITVRRRTRDRSRPTTRARTRSEQRRAEGAVRPPRHLARGAPASGGLTGVCAERVAELLLPPVRLAFVELALQLADVRRQVVLPLA